jgi:hypothetical protein
MKPVLGRLFKPKNNLRFTDQTMPLQAAIAGNGFALLVPPISIAGGVAVLGEELRMS